MKKFAAVLLGMVMLYGMAAFAADSEMKGWVADDKCAAKAGPGQEACTKSCLKRGAKMVFVSDSDKQVLAIANPDKLKGHEGHHVDVKGSVENGTLTVADVKMLPQEGGGGGQHQH